MSAARERWRKLLPKQRDTIIEVLQDIREQMRKAPRHMTSNEAVVTIDRHKHEIDVTAIETAMDLLEEEGG